MCGIAGFVDIGSSDPRADLGRMLDRLDHRGPDGRGATHEGGLALGMTRLAIIDLEGGAQPQLALDGAVRIVFNGEIYNHEALRRELEGRGHTFRTRSDTEAILRSYVEWGTDAFERLDGMFAVAIHDARTDSLVLARDRFGEKPLYWWPIGRGLAFASEPKALRALAPMPALDEDAMLDYLQLGYVPGPRTAWRDVSKLSPGHVLVRTPGGTHTTPFWELEPSERSVTDAPVADLRARLLEAVRSRLIADVPVGVLLSGGVDSSLVAWAAAQHTPHISTFTVGFEDPARDESGAARATAARLGTEHHETVVTAQDALGVVADLPTVYDEPFADSSAIPTLLIARHAARSLKVVLTGDGGDELFSGYTRYAQAERLHARSGPLTRRIAPWLVPLATSRWSVPGAIGNRAVLRCGTAADVHAELTSLLSSPHLRRLTRGSSPETLSDVLADSFARFGPVAAQAADLRLYLTDDLLVKMDRASMSASLEARSPFLAPPLVQWALGLPQEQRGLAGAKALPRALLGEVLPGDLSSRAKQGFSVPISDWLRGPLRPLLLDALASSHLVAAGYVDPAAIGDLTKRLDRGRSGVAGALWAILCFELWHAGEANRADRVPSPRRTPEDGGRT
jgi:asparagine synthase (glutamine-hydrolysing)